MSAKKAEPKAEPKVYKCKITGEVLSYRGYGRPPVYSAKGKAIVDRENKDRANAKARAARAEAAAAKAARAETKARRKAAGDAAHAPA